MSRTPKKEEKENKLESSIDLEAALKEHWHDMPPELQNCEYCHVSIFYAEKDRERVLLFKEHLEKEIDLKEDGKVIVMLYDGPEFESLTNSKLGHVASVVERSTFQFMFMTHNFVEDKWMELCSDSLLMNTIYDREKNWSVVPVDTEELSQNTFKYPMGLNALKGVPYYNNDEFYREKLKHLIKARAQTRINMINYHETKQRKWMEKQMHNGQPRKVNAVSEELQHLEINKCRRNKTEGRITCGVMPTLQHSQCETQLNDHYHPPVLSSGGSLHNSGLESTSLEEDCGVFESEQPSFWSNTSETKFKRLHSPCLEKESKDNSEHAENKNEGHIRYFQTVNVYNAKSVQIGDQNIVKECGIGSDQEVVNISDKEPSYETVGDESKTEAEDLQEAYFKDSNVTVADGTLECRLEPEEKQQQAQYCQRLFTKDDSLLSVSPEPAYQENLDKEDLCVITEPVELSSENSDSLVTLPGFQHLLSMEPESKNVIKTPESGDIIQTDDLDDLGVKKRGDTWQSPNPKTDADECPALAFDTPILPKVEDGDCTALKHFQIGQTGIAMTESSVAFTSSMNRTEQSLANTSQVFTEYHVNHLQVPSNTQNTYILNSVYCKRKIHPISTFFNGGVGAQNRGCSISDADVLHVD